MSAADFEAVAAATEAAYRRQREETEARPEPAPRLDPITGIDWAALDGQPPPERDFIVPGWLPCGAVTMVTGDGGLGKTMLALTLASATALGRPWLGLDTARTPVLGLFAEEDDVELHRRAARIVGFMGIRLGELGGRFLAQGRIGLDNALCAHTRGRPAEPLPLLAHVEETARAIGAGLIVLDHAAQMFTGEENARADVTAFLNALAGIARRTGAAVLLLAHPPKSRGEAAADYSGSTAWIGCVRCLWTLKRVALADDDGAPDDGLILTRAKANYAEPGEEIRLRWIDGLLRRDDGEAVSGIEAGFRKAEAEAAFLAALDELTAQHRAASHHPRAGNYAPKLIAAAGLANGHSRHALERAMNDLLRDRRIVAAAPLWRGADRKPVTGLARAGTVEPEAAEPPAETWEAAIARLAGLPEPDFQRERRETAKRLGVQVRALDSAVSRARREAVAGAADTAAEAVP